MVGHSPSSFHRAINLLPSAGFTVATGLSIATSAHKGFFTGTFVLALGVLGTAATVDVTIIECATIGGTYAPVVGAAFTQKVKATDDGKIYVGEMYMPPRLKFIKAQVIVAGATSQLSLMLLLDNPVSGGSVDAAQTASEALAAPIGTGLGVGIGYDFKVLA